jgi:hypothetical protein
MMTANTTWGRCSHGGDQQENLPKKSHPVSGCQPARGMATVMLKASGGLVLPQAVQTGVILAVLGHQLQHASRYGGNG